MMDGTWEQRGCRRFLIGLVVCCLFSLFAIHSSRLDAAEASLKIGYLNVAKVFDDYQRTKESEQTLEQRAKQKQTEVESRVTELKKLRQHLELLNDQAKDSKAKELEEKSDEFQRLKTRSERELLRERNQTAREILDEIERVVREYAAANGFSVILDERSVLYGQDVYDVTDEVLKLLNDRYAAKPARGGKP